MSLHRTILFAALLGLAFAGAAQSAIHVSSAREFDQAVDRIGNRAGIIVLERGRYGKLVIGPRSWRARWLTVRAKRGALAKTVVVARSRRVRLIGLRVTNYWGMDARLLVTRSANVKLEGLTVVGRPDRRARVRVFASSSVTVRNSDFSRCGNRPGANCLSVPASANVTVADSVFHDCFGCDFLAISSVRGMRVVRSQFDRALPGPCVLSTSTVAAEYELAGPAESGTCNHQDLIQVVGGHDITIEGNRFGVYQFGAAQLYLSGQRATDGVTVRGNLFQRTDPAVPDLEAVNGIIVGNPPGFNGLPANVLVEGNTIESGATRDPARYRYWPGVANSLIVSDGYNALPLEARPVVRGNMLASVSHPELVCLAQIEPAC